MRKESQKFFKYSLYAIFGMATLYGLVLFLFSRIWNFYDYEHIKSIVINEKTYSLYKQIKDCKNNHCYIVAACSSGYANDGCPVNVALMDDALPMFRLKTIYDIYDFNNALVMAVPIAEYEDPNLETDRKYIYDKSTNNGVAREFHKLSIDKGLFKGTYHWIVEYR
jgi:hypothetical protein